MKISPKPYELGIAGEEPARKSPLSAKPYELAFAEEEAPKRSLPRPPLSAAPEFLGGNTRERSSLSTIKMALSVTEDDGGSAQKDGSTVATLIEDAASPTPHKKPSIRKKIYMLSEVASPKPFDGKRRLPRAKKLQVKWPPVTSTAGRSSTAFETTPSRSPKTCELGFQGSGGDDGSVSASGRTRPRSRSFTTKINLYESLAMKVSQLQAPPPLDLEDSTRSIADSPLFPDDDEDNAVAPNADDVSLSVEDQSSPEQPKEDRIRVSYRIRYNPFIVKDAQERTDAAADGDEEDYAEEDEERGEERKKTHGSCRGYGRPDVWVTPIKSKNGERKWIAKRVWDLEEKDEEEPEYEIEESGLAEGVQELLGLPGNEDMWSTSAGKDSLPLLPGRRRSPSFTVRRVVDVDGDLQGSETVLPLDGVDFVAQLSCDASALTWDSTFRSFPEPDTTAPVPIDEQATVAGGSTITDSTSSETEQDSASSGLDISSSADEDERSHDTTQTKDSGADSQDDSEDYERRDKGSKKKKKKKKKKSKNVTIKYDHSTPRSVTKKPAKHNDWECELTKSGTPTWKKHAKEVDAEESEIKLWWQS